MADVIITDFPIVASDANLFDETADKSAKPLVLDGNGDFKRQGHLARQPNWEQGDNTQPDFIKNKPAIPTVLDDYYIQIKADGDGQTDFSNPAFENGVFKYIHVVNSRYILPTDFSLTGDTITLTNAESGGVYKGELLLFHFQK